jgi:hypothetical protein
MRTAVLGLLLGCCLPAAAVTIDGSIDAAEWADAQVFDQFAVTQPLTLEQPQLRNRAWVQARPEGLAVAYRAEQPADIERRRPRRSRDASPMASDLVYVMVDFDGTGERAYEFTVSLSGTQRDGTISDETRFSYDWDGRWDSAVAETENDFSVEWLLPWSLVPMRQVSGDRRTIGIHFGRYVEALAQRHAYPGISFQQPRYVSLFAQVEVANFSQSLLQIIPYASATHDLAGDRGEFRSGVDLQWKPSGRLQLAAALNPDFGQVESDDLVVNFDAIETFFSDKRPFFTENQSLFDRATPQGGQLVYTRRVGGSSDDGSGRAADIDLALKLSGSSAGFDYGAFVAEEADAAGRRFIALRNLYPGERLTFGQFILDSERPALDRHARVHAVDGRWRQSQAFAVEGALLHSEIEQGDRGQQGAGGWLTLEYAPSEALTAEATLTHLGGELELNDLGFLPRNNLLQGYASFTRRYTGFSTADARAAVAWNLNGSVRYNDSGERLPGFLYLSRSAEWRSGGTSYTELGYDSSGIDDLIARGNGAVRLGARSSLWHYYQSPQLGRFKYQLGGWTFQEGVAGRAWQLETQLRLQWTPTLASQFEWYPRVSDDWLIWREGSQLSSYDRRQDYLSLNLDWLPADRHELRLKAQWIVIDARDPRPWQIGAAGRLLPDDRAEAAFSLRSFGLQLRYRLELAPQRELYLVYGRGGFAIDEHRRDTLDLIRSASELRDADQFLVKLRWAL